MIHSLSSGKIKNEVNLSLWRGGVRKQNTECRCDETPRAVSGILLCYWSVPGGCPRTGLHRCLCQSSGLLRGHMYGRKTGECHQLDWRVMRYGQTPHLVRFLETRTVPRWAAPSKLCCVTGFFFFLKSLSNLCVCNKSKIHKENKFSSFTNQEEHIEWAVNQIFLNLNNHRVLWIIQGSPSLNLYN